MFDAEPRPRTEDPDRLNATDGIAWIQRARAGDFETAWAVSDRIRRRSGPQRDWSVPRHLQRIWNGADLAGRRVLIRCYHGLGDTIQFIRYAPLVRAGSQEVIVWTQPALLNLLRTVRGIDRLIPLHDGTPDVKYDVDVEVMELPYVFRTTLRTIPADVPYLRIQPARIVAPFTRVGIAWRGGSWDDARSIPFELLQPLFDFPHISWYSLQLAPAANEHHEKLEALNTRGVLRLARCIRALDLVISIDSMPAHLAGALAVPVWTLLAHHADWRWMRDRSDSPWYPSMRLFRQPSPGDWRSVLEDVAGALAIRVARGGGPAAR